MPLYACPALMVQWTALLCASGMRAGSAPALRSLFLHGNSNCAASVMLCGGRHKAGVSSQPVFNCIMALMVNTGQVKGCIWE